MKRFFRRLAAVLAAVLLVCVVGFGVFVGSPYQADDTALAVAASAHTEGRFTTLVPVGPDSGIGVVFYPGANVQAEAYLPLLQQLAEQGVTCVLAEMPFNLAFLGADAAQDAMALHPQVRQWYLMGHSLGGAMACSFAADHPDEVAGLVLLGAYVYGEVPQPTLVLYGENDLVLSREKLSGGENELVIPGGNHAWFGNYGEQKGDGAASITRQEQQSITARYALEFMGLAAAAQPAA